MEAVTVSSARFWELALKIAITVILTLPIGWERFRSTQSMGVRTYILVAVASCSYVLVAVAVLGSGSDAQARIIQGLMGGIGFIGGGAILKEGATVRGTATAASIWATGAMGAAIGYDLYEIALLLSIVMLATLWGLPANRPTSTDAAVPGTGAGVSAMDRDAQETPRRPSERTADE